MGSRGSCFSFFDRHIFVFYLGSHGIDYLLGFLDMVRAAGGGLRAYLRYLSFLFFIISG